MHASLLAMRASPDRSLNNNYIIIIIIIIIIIHKQLNNASDAAVACYVMSQGHIEYH